MGRIRSLLRRIVKPAGMVGVVGIVSLSLVIVQPAQSAYALEVKYRDIKAAETFIMGATKTVAPAAQVAMTAASVTPVGFGIRMASLALTAYSTKDIWMPIVAGAWGAATGSNANTAPAAGHGVIDPNITVTQLTNATMPTQADKDTKVLVAVETKNGGTSKSFQFSSYIQCRANKDGTGASYDKSAYSFSTYSSSTGTHRYFNLACTQGYLTGAIVGVVRGDPLLQSENPSAGGGPTNVMRFGTLTAPSGQAFEPYAENVKYKVKSECIDSSGNLSTIEAESSGDMVRLPSCAAAGKGHGTGKTTITGLAPGLAPSEEKTLWETAAPARSTETPLCDSIIPSDGCVLEVLKNDQPCTVGDPECGNWESEAAKDPAKYKCKFGPYTLPMAQCAMLSRAYITGGSLLSDPHGAPSAAPAPGTYPNGQPVAAPAPTITTVPGGSAPAPAPGTTTGSASCFPGGWEVFNPMWIVDGISCSFIPKMDITQRVGQLQALAGTKAPLSWMQPTMTGPGGSGCPAWVVEVPGYSKNVVCESSFTAAIVGARGPLFGIVAAAMIWPLFRSLWYAAIPVLRVTPGSSK